MTCRRNSKQGRLKKVVIFVEFFIQQNKFHISDYCNALTNLPVLSDFPLFDVTRNILQGTGKYE
jgi:hypothetical protein